MAVASSLREGFEVIVVKDGVSVPSAIEKEFATSPVRWIDLGRNFGKMNGVVYYGLIATTVGAYLARSDFVAILGDDDEFMEGAGDTYRQCLRDNPRVDIWIPGLRYSNGHEVCLRRGELAVGNVSHPLLRTTIFASCPMYHHPHWTPYNVADFHHIAECARRGFLVDWIGKVCVAIRPRLEGHFGNGRDE
jgi:hypothetical protein